MASLRGLPPLPKSLSGVMDVEGLRLLEADMQGPSSTRYGSQEPPPLPPGRSRKQSNLDAQLALLRQEMVGLRQLDLSLLSQLWSLNESIQEFRVLLQDDDAAPLSPPSPSSADDEDDDEFFQVAVPRQQQSRPKRHRAPPEGLKASKKALPFRLPPHRPNEDDDDDDPKQRRYSSASSPSSSTRSSFEFGEV